MDDIGPKDDGWILTQFTNECLDPYDDTSVVGKDRCAVPYRYLSRLCEMASQGAAARREGVIEGLERLESELDDLSRRFRRTGATLPAPDLTGTPEGSVLTGMCVALATVEIRRDEIRAEIERLRNES